MQHLDSKCNLLWPLLRFSQLYRLDRMPKLRRSEWCIGIPHEAHRPGSHGLEQALCLGGRQ